MPAPESVPVERLIDSLSERIGHMSADAVAKDAYIDECRKAIAAQDQAIAVLVARNQEMASILEAHGISPDSPPAEVREFAEVAYTDDTAEAIVGAG